MQNEKNHWVWMASLPGIGAKAFYQILKTFGGASRFFDAVRRGSALLDSVPAELLSSARAACSVQRAAELVCALKDGGIRAVTRLCEDYPAPLARITWPPPVLFVKGALCAMERAIGIVGTRRCTRRGYELTRRIASELQMPVVSGLARGVDTAAHLGALDAGFPTAAVLGCGVDVVYPPENEQIYNNIVDGGGAVISELPVGAGPLAANFPVRNRIIAGLVRGLLVVESGLSGGTAITASLAIGCGRDVFAVPGSPYLDNSALPDMLIANGAAPVRDAADIRAYYGEPTAGAETGHAEAVALDFAQSRILELLHDEDMGAEALASHLDLPAGEVNVALTLMELSGLIRRLPGGSFGV